MGYNVMFQFIYTLCDDPISNLFISGQLTLRYIEKYYIIVYYSETMFNMF